jgi:acetoacetate decarboxylase
MGYKHRVVDIATVAKSMCKPNFLLKIIPRADCTGPEICELVSNKLEDLDIKGAWSGPAALSLFPHAMANVAHLPVRDIVSCIHIQADLTLGLGQVVHNYLTSDKY